MSRRTPRTGRRPALLEPGVEETFLAAVADGTPLTHAAIAAGVNPTTFHRWMTAGEEADRRAQEAERQGERPDLDDVEQRYREFRHKVLRLRARVSSENVRRVAKVAEGGFLVKRTPLITKDGVLVRGDDGEVMFVEEFAPPDWRAAKFLLETSFPREFRRAEQSDPLSGEGSAGAIESEDVAVSLAARLAKVTAERRMEIEAAPEDVVDAEVIEDA